MRLQSDWLLLEKREETDKVAYNILADNPIQVVSADGVDFLAPRIGYKEKRDKTAYNILADNPTQVVSADGVNFLAPRIGYKNKRD